jgi:tetratricopeptide (TPR) repeat protein
MPLPPLFGREKTMRTDRRRFWHLLEILLLGLMLFGLPSFSEGSQLFLRTLGEGTDAPAPLLNLLQEQISPSNLPGSYAAAYRGWQAYFSLLPESEGSLVNPPAALRRAEEESFRRALQDVLEKQGVFQGFQHPSLGVSAMLHLRGKLLVQMESAPGVWKRNGFFEGRPWNLLLLPPENLSITTISPDLPSREELLPTYRRLALQEGRSLRRKGNPEAALPYYREWLALSPLGPSTPSLLEYAETLLESNHLEEARELLEKTAQQRKNMLSEGEAYSLRLLWEQTYPPQEKASPE